MPYDFFMSRYKQAYVQETLAFVDSLVNDKPPPCSGIDGLIALTMAIVAGKSAEERRWVEMRELAPELCRLEAELPSSDLTPEQCEITLVDSDSGALELEILSKDPKMGLAK